MYVKNVCFSEQKMYFKNIAERLKQKQVLKIQGF
jgi:hypothetical protein